MIDFVKMKQRNSRTNFERDVQRIPTGNTPRGWTHAQGGTTPPRVAAVADAAHSSDGLCHVHALAAFELGINVIEASVVTDEMQGAVIIVDPMHPHPLTFTASRLGYHSNSFQCDYCRGSVRTV